MAIDDIATVIWLVPISTQSETWFNKAINNEDNIYYYNDIMKLINDI